MKINDIVRILPEDPDGVNGYGRLVGISDGYGYVSNTNMPFQGTFSYKKFPLSDLTKEKK